MGQGMWGNTPALVCTFVCRPPAGLLQSYTRCYDVLHPNNQLVKSIVNGKYVGKLLNPHSFTYKAGRHAGKGLPMVLFHFCPQTNSCSRLGGHTVDTSKQHAYPAPHAP